MHEFAVVGSGIGGSAIAAALHAAGRDVVLFEKEPYLGGCSSTFTRGGYRYNTGATTLAGYQDGHVVKRFFDAIGFTPTLIESDPAIVIMQGGKSTMRFNNLDCFLDEMDRDYPHPKNREFWQLVHEIGTVFYSMDGYHYRNSGVLSKLLSLTSYLPLFLRLKPYLTQRADRFIRRFFGTLSEDYLSFIQAQIMIVAQAPAREINFLTAALALGYTFNRTHYVPGGMGQLFEGMTAALPNVLRNTQIVTIAKDTKGYILKSKKAQTIRANNIILNSTVYDTPTLFEAGPIQRHYAKYKRLDNHQSSFMLYLTVKTDRAFHHHYQLIEPEPFEWCLTNALFVSVSDPTDSTLVQDGYRSITASIHTDVRWWQDETHYRGRKTRLFAQLKALICAKLGIDENSIVNEAAATPRTFHRFILRSQLGGNPITMKNLLPFLPGNDTPFKGLYHVGDSVYAAQGWPGVMLGVQNLRSMLHV